MSLARADWLWLNGKLVRWDEANTHVSAHTLHLGSGVFEAIRCYETAEGAALFRLEAHLERLRASASMYQMELPYTLEEIAAAIRQTIDRNHFSSCYIRVLCYLGSGSLGVYPRDCPVELAILAWPLGAYLAADGLEKGVRVTVSSWVKFHSRMMPTTAKACGQYLNSILAVREAISRGYDEAILLDAEGNVAEGSSENIFIVRNGKLLTNDERSSILLGITRDAVIGISRDLGFDVDIGTIRLADLLSADEAFFTGTAVEVTPIVEVDGKRLGVGTRGPVSEKIQRAFFAATSGHDTRYRSWLHFVTESMPEH